MELSRSGLHRQTRIGRALRRHPGGKVCWKVELGGTAHIDHIGLCMLQLLCSVQMPWSSLVDIIEPDRIRSQNLEIGDRGPERTLQHDQSDEDAFSGVDDWMLPRRSAIIDL